ncbi:superoxide dismutase [Proteus hauseri ATCC 700826]|uniref:Superoxide dismutase [Cu-Zn] n=1 Tax=Proteus hauseri ATCC 700826 TaxID=1354271 RepID=A0AAJ3HS67_PROHU|nr:superoxide dismutase family protein [Proteus hauseri]OAT46847.1 superoxide dismutase [Proteus hauseri ATCC 700826]
MKLTPWLLSGFLFTSIAASAATLDVTLKEALPTGEGNDIGVVTITETDYGLLFTPKINGLAPGIHGFHVHANGSCEPDMKEGKPVPALKAGGHLDPENKDTHLGPYNKDGHLGDLPGLVVSDKGVADYAVLAPRLTKLEQIKDKALMIHMGGDNYSDHPEVLGGGGARMACGVIK